MRRLRSLISIREDRGAERWRRAILSSITALASRFGNIAALVVTMPMAFEYLGAERFGVWMVVSSLGMLMSFADFGVGNGVMTLIAAETGREDQSGLRSIVSSGFFGMLTLGLLLAGISVGISQFFDWSGVFNAKSALARAESGAALLIALLCIAFSLPATLASKIQMGLQKGYLANAWLGAGSMLSFVAIIAVIKLDGGLPLMALALFGAPPFAMLINSCLFYFKTDRELAPRWRDVKSDILKTTMRLGIGFFVLQMVAALTYRADAMILTHVTGPETAGNYAVYERIFSLATMLVAVAAGPMWPAFSEAIQRGEDAWTRRTLIRMMMWSMAAVAVVTIPIALLHGPLVEWWFGSALPVSMLLIIGFVVWKIIEAAAVPAALFLNGAGIIRPQIFSALSLLILALPTKILLIPHLGSWSIIWITIFAYIITSAIPLGIIIFKRLYMPFISKTSFNRP